MNKIQRTSRYLRWLFIVFMGLTPLMYIASWFFLPDMVKKDSFFMGFDIIPRDLVAMIPGDVIVQHPLTTMMRLLGLTISLVPMTITMLIYSNLITLFLMYERLSYFNLENVAIIRRIGIYLLLAEVLRPFVELAMSALLTWQNGPGHRLAVMSFKGSNLGLIVTGIMIILISWIIAEGHRLNEEQRLTI